MRNEATDGETMEACTLSIVAPALNEEGNLERFFEDLQDVLRDLEVSWELIFVDDGSSDGTWDKVRSLHQREPRVRGIRLSRNFGHQYAVLAGLTRARGDAVVSMDADLQHPPRVIPMLLEEWRRGSQIVHTRRRDGGGESAFKRLTSMLFYRIFSLLSGTPLRIGSADFRLLDRQVVDGLMGFEEEGLFLRGLVHWMGYTSGSVEFDSEPRLTGTTSYTLPKMVKLAWIGVSSFSLIPLRICIVMGFLTSAVAFEQLLEALYWKLIKGGTVPGWTQTMVVMTFLFGVLFILLGIVGEYIVRILIEVRRRPRFLVRDELGAAVSQAPPAAGERIGGGTS
jgi:dolichol-phosphate mannosyltransferase